MRCGPGERTALVIALSCLLVSGCSSSPRFSGPSWNLTGGRDALPPPAHRPMAPTNATASPSPEIVYRGGRDPITGKATASGRGAPQGIERHELPPPPATAASHSPTTTPTATVYAPATVPPARVTVGPGGRRTVEVLPGHSLAMIADRNRTSIAAMMAANKMRDPYVYPGQVLVLP